MFTLYTKNIRSFTFKRTHCIYATNTLSWYCLRTRKILLVFRLWLKTKLKTIVDIFGGSMKLNNQKLDLQSPQSQVVFKWIKKTNSNNWSLKLKLEVFGQSHPALWWTFPKAELNLEDIIDVNYKSAILLKLFWCFHTLWHETKY